MSGSLLSHIIRWILAIGDGNNSRIGATPERGQVTARMVGGCNQMGRSSTDANPTPVNLTMLLCTVVSHQCSDSLDLG